MTTLPRAVLAAAVAAATLSATAPALAAGADDAALVAVDLETENRDDALGIDIGTQLAVPLLSWKLETRTPGATADQTAYEVRAASTMERLLQNRVDVWDSGRVPSSRTTNVKYTGARLDPRETVLWQVRVWDGKGRASAWSEPASWEMGIGERDWSADWIENPSYDYTQPDGTETPLPVFGKDFAVQGEVAKARLYMTGLGMYSTTLNGQPISENVLEPGQTTYADEVDYRTYDLTAQLRSGQNVLGIETGSGTYQRVVTPGRYFFGGRLERFTTYGEPKAIAQLEITYTDGRRQVVGTDSTWRTALGPTTFSSWWSGEEYDGRRAATAPSSPANLSGPGWQDAAVAQLSATTTPRATTPLKADPRPPVTVAENVEPTTITPRGNGSYILDFGANRAGWPNLDVSGPAGTTITMIPAEQLAADGSLDIASTGAGEGEQIAYRYTLAGTGAESWHPRFTYSGYRYLQVDGLPSPPTPQTVTMDVTYAANERTSSFSSSNDVLDQIHEITLRSTQSNMLSVLTDCPDREKGPYTGDNLHNIDALLTDYDMAAYQQQLVRNMATAQREPGDESPGLIANIAPEFHRVLPIKLNYPQGVIQFTDEVNWGGAIIRIPWQLYETYGDTRTMSTYYKNMVAWLDYESANKAANNGDIPGLGDWIAFDNTTPLQLPIVAGHFTAADDMSKIAGVLGKKSDQVKYRKLADQLRQEFTDRFRHVDATGVFYGSDSEASNAMALNAGLVAEGDRQAVLDRLVAAVRRAGDHITTGSVALASLFRALEEGGRDDVIYDMVVNPTSPGYGYMIASGRTTLSESFSGTGSQNHHFLGQVNDWLVDGLAGITQAPGSVGYEEIDIDPAMVGDLTRAEGSYTSTYGTISSRWEKDTAGGVRMDVTVPAGTTATVHVPAAATVAVQVGGGTGPQLVSRSDDEALYRVPAGSYSFQVAPVQ